MSGFRGLVTVWLHVDRGGVPGSGGPGNRTKLLVGTGLSTPFSFTWSFVDCQVCHGHRACVHSGCAAGRRGQRGCRGDGRPDRVRARVLDEMAGGTGPAGLLEDLLAEDVIARALREAPAGHKYDRVLTAKMTVICVLVACLFSSAGYDSVLATAFAARPEARSASGSRPIRRHNQARPDALPQPAIGDQEQSDSTIVVAAEQAMRPSGVLDAIYCRKKLIKSLVSGFGFGPVYRCSTAT